MTNEVVLITREGRVFVSKKMSLDGPPGGGVRGISLEAADGRLWRGVVVPMRPFGGGDKRNWEAHRFGEYRTHPGGGKAHHDEDQRKDRKGRWGID